MPVGKSHATSMQLPAATQVATDIFLLFREARLVFLRSAFGFVSSCKHQPSCGDFFVAQVKHQGLVVGGAQGVLRLLRCF